MNMKCEKCKNALPSDSEFCPFCGEKIPDQEEPLSSERGPDEVVTQLRCTKCGNALPSDSEFCPYCGEKLPAQAQHRGDDSSSGREIIAEIGMPQPGFDSPPTPDRENAFSRREQSVSARQIAAPMALRERAIPRAGDPAQKSEAAVDDRKKKPCRYCGGPVDLKTKRCTFCGKRLSRFPERAVGIASLAMVFAALVGLNIYQCLSNASAIADLERHIKTQNVTIANQKSSIFTQDNLITSLEDKASYYNQILIALSNGKLGAASSNFKVDESVIVISKGKTRQVTLTASYYSSRTYFIDYERSTTNASITFGDQWYYNNIAVYVKANNEGVTVITFNNDLNSETFKMIIIVTD